MVVIALTARDISVLFMVHSYGGLTADHIHLRFFPSSGVKSSPCYRRIAFLVAAGYLTSTRTPSISGQGSGKALLTLGPLGRKVVAAQLDIPLAELTRFHMESPFTLHHFLGLCDSRLSIEMACERSNIFDLVEWLSDRELEIRVKDPKTHKEIVLIPDATFTLALPDGTEQRFLVEFDLSTVPVGRLRPKLAGYLCGVSNPVLFIVPDGLRENAVVRWTGEEADRIGADPTLIWIARKEDVQPSSVLSEPIWHIVNGPAAVSLEELVTGQEAQTFPSNGHHEVVTMQFSEGLAE